jgi:hypothetical protein
MNEQLQGSMTWIDQLMLGIVSSMLMIISSFMIYAVVSFAVRDLIKKWRKKNENPAQRHRSS